MSKCILFSLEKTLPALFVLLILFPDFLTANLPPDQSAWHQFRGANRNGQVPDLPDYFEWPENTPVLLWQKNIGSGFSEVSIADDRLFLMMAEKTDSISGHEYLVCLDAQTGTEIWQTKVGDLFIDADEWGDGPRSTPTIYHDMVYCLSGSGRLSAIEIISGNILWAVDFVKDFGSTLPRWGYAASPLVVENKVYIEVGGKDAHGFAAFDCQTGELKWHAANITAAYNSAIEAHIDDSRHIVFVNGSKLYAFSSSGDSLWSFNMPLRSPMALPLFIPPNKIFVSAANDAGSFLIEVSNNQVRQLMVSSRMRNDWSSSCYKDGYIYGFNVATLICMDAEKGEQKWQKRGFGKGSLIMVHDRLFVLSDLGKITILKASPAAYEEIDSFEALEGRSWTAPSYYDGKLYVRNHTHIACFDIALINAGTGLETHEKPTVPVLMIH